MNPGSTTVRPDSARETHARQAPHPNQRFILELTLWLGAMGLLLLIGLKAWIDVDRNGDTWAYHLPFATRLMDMIGPGDLILDDYFEPRLQGFSVLGEHLLASVCSPIDFRRWKHRLHAEISESG